ncbi:hypothetical protein OC834_002348 [Tilletia horrida]|nr:hypothetical protein OC834_002348 [Tilletia horrida]
MASSPSASPSSRRNKKSPLSKTCAALSLSALVAVLALAGSSAATSSERSHHHHAAGAEHAVRSGALPMDGALKRALAPGQFASSGFDFVNDKVRGVNLGNWLVLEPWMMDTNTSTVLNAMAKGAPSSNAIVDEWTMGSYIDKEWMANFFTQHFDTWINETDFEQIAAAGLNHVRIPIGHWAFEDCIEQGAPYQALNRFDKLKEGVLLAKKHGIKVWIDLHGTPGSQNGYPGSGHAAPAQWPNTPENYALTQKAFNYLAQEFTKPEYSGTVTAIQPVNEPIGAQQRSVQQLLNQYYPWSWDALAYPNGTDQPASTVMLTTHDAWQGLAYWEKFYNQTQAQRVIMDCHPYFVYSDQEKSSKDTFRLNEVCQYGANINRSMNFYPTVAGEWTIGAPQGDNIPSLRDLPVTDAVTFKSGSPFTAKYMQFLAVNFRAQQQIFEAGSGWLFWNWKHLAYADQSYQTGMKYGWLPSNAQELKQQPFGSLCSGTKFVTSSAFIAGTGSSGSGGTGTGAAGSNFLSAKLPAIAAVVSGSAVAVALSSVLL